MKTATFLACAVALATAPAARAGEYVSIVQQTTVNAPAETTWARVKGYCGVGAWLKVSCEIVGGADGELGAVRRLASHIDEVIVARTPMSYTYADVDPQILYHGTLEVRPVDAGTSTIVYSLFYDQAAVKPGARAADRDRRAEMFARVLVAMKAVAEAK